MLITMCCSQKTLARRNLEPVDFTRTGPGSLGPKGFPLKDCGNDVRCILDLGPLVPLGPKGPKPWAVRV